MRGQEAANAQMQAQAVVAVRQRGGRRPNNRAGGAAVRRQIAHPLAAKHHRQKADQHQAVPQGFRSQTPASLAGAVPDPKQRPRYGPLPDQELYNCSTATNVSFSEW
mmetsp:Transcript_15178/g.26317  ORF Transcript_15178/g.26317 Transcript_15178/m.26317 type:complete len:107 (+) Transcript_15178:866-1186(+)